MGFDAFGLPAEQYAIQTGQHPAVTTAKNIETYKRQLKQIGFSFDWSREVQTSDPSFYKWTQWIFMQLFNAWYNNNEDKAEHIQSLIFEFRENGNNNVDAACSDDTPSFTADQWNAFNEQQRENILQHYRIAYQSETMVNWCAALGTVLSNDEVKDGVSERGGYPVERIKMLQWSMRISAYAERLLTGLDTIDWPEPVREMQRNWIGKSVGCELDFALETRAGLTLNPSTKEVDFKDLPSIKVFTTRIDTIYGVTFMVLAPEHELVEKITTPEQREEVLKYVEVAGNRSERERMSEVKRISGVFTGAFCINPFNNEKVPVWIADYVLAGYGTGAVMAVPSSDTRDYAFAKHFNLPIIPVLEGPNSDITKDNFDPK
jgi:leucyl-tRNA synthetase